MLGGRRLCTVAVALLSVVNSNARPQDQDACCVYCDGAVTCGSLVVTACGGCSNEEVDGNSLPEEIRTFSPRSDDGEYIVVATRHTPPIVELWENRRWPGAVVGSIADLSGVALSVPVTFVANREDRDYDSATGDSVPGSGGVYFAVRATVRNGRFEIRLPEGGAYRIDIDWSRVDAEVEAILVSYRTGLDPSVLGPGIVPETAAPDPQP